ncbi:unnamed protein product [Urochloa humidicola]
MATKWLDKYGRDLTEHAARGGGGGDPVVGRDAEIDRVVSILSRRSKNSAVLVGAPGVGKTAIAEGLAQRLAAGSVPGALAGARLVELSVPSMMSGIKYAGTLEERVTGVIADAEAALDKRKVVLFVDEIHTLVGSGRTESGGMDASDMLKPALARGGIRCLGATTDDEYLRVFAGDRALERRFQKVRVAEPGEEGTLAILRRLRPAYQEHHGLTITDEALAAAVRLAGRYVTGRHFPDKAIDLVDEACATARLHLDSRAGGSQGGRGSETIQDQTIGPDHMAQVVSNWTGIPVTRMGQDERRRLLDLPEMLRRRVVGQDEAVAAVANAVLRSRCGLGNPGQPSGSFLFLGPTGVGKTELAKALAEQLFGDENHLIRIDMSEYVGNASVTRLIGAPPGTVGYGEGGQLTEQVMRRPYSVVLFDEVEKGDDKVFDLFLQILGDGRLTDAKGRTVDFTNTIVIMTSNLGARHVARRFRPELINRLDETVAFRPLSGEALREVVRMQLAARGIGLDVADAAVDAVLSVSSDQVAAYGARPIKRCLESAVVTRIARMMVEEEVDDGCSISIGADGGELVFSVEKPERRIITQAPPAAAASVQEAVGDDGGGCDVISVRDDAKKTGADETGASSSSTPATEEVKPIGILPIATWSIVLLILCSALSEDDSGK